jgi:DNA-binding LacI/PurR family transcriptional regulator
LGRSIYSIEEDIKIMKNKINSGNTVTLKSVAEHVGLTAGTVSLVLNHAPQSSSIPQRTKDRIFAAASELNYRPNLLARALRTNTAPPVTTTAVGVNNSPGALMFVGAENYARAILAIRKAGLSVPGDVSIVGVNNVPAAMEHLASARGTA